MKGYLKPLNARLGLTGLCAAFFLSAGCLPVEEEPALPRTLSFDVSGLETGETITLNLNGGEQTKDADADGTYEFPFDLYDGDAYAVTSSDDPIGKLCTITDGSGTVSASTPAASVVCEHILLTTIYSDPAVMPDANLAACVQASASDLGVTTVAGLTAVGCLGGTVITDATGIEQLVALESLALLQHSLTTVDISTLTQLNELALVLDELSAIDLSANTLLTSLDLRLNQLTTINIDNNTLLSNVDLTSNPLDCATRLYLDGFNEDLDGTPMTTGWDFLYPESAGCTP